MPWFLLIRSVGKEKIMGLDALEINKCSKCGREGSVSDFTRDDYRYALINGRIRSGHTVKRWHVRCSGLCKNIGPESRTYTGAIKAWNQDNQEGPK